LIETEISGIDIQKNKIKTFDGKSFEYKRLIWAGDSNILYKIINTSEVSIKDTKNIQLQKEVTENNHGCDSILTTYLGVNLDKNYFEKRCGAHLFYTTKSAGI